MDPDAAPLARLGQGNAVIPNHISMLSAIPLIPGD